MVAVQEQVLDDVVDLEVELGDGVLEGFFYVADVLLEELGQDGEVSVAEADLVDVGVFLAKDGH